MYVEILIPPVIEPVLVSDVKSHCRIDDDLEDNLLLHYISTARETVENMTGRIMIDTTFVQHDRCWASTMRLLRGNPHTINSVVYDPVGGGAEQTVDTQDYYLHRFGGGYGALAFFDDFNSPDLLSVDHAYRIRTTFVAGYGVAAKSVPDALKMAILYLVSLYYDNRSPVTFVAAPKQLQFTIDSLVGPYRLF